MQPNFDLFHEVLFDSTKGSSKSALLEISIVISRNTWLEFNSDRVL